MTELKLEYSNSDKVCVCVGGGGGGVQGAFMLVHVPIGYLCSSGK